MRRITRRRITRNRSGLNGPKNLREGTILVLAAVMIVMILAFTAFTIDMGYIALTKTQLQSASDASAHAAGIELVQGTGPIPVTAATVQALAEQAAVAVASSHKTGDHLAAYVEPNRDMRFGLLEWNSVTGSWEESWGVGPYNLVEVTVHRDQSVSGNGDRPLTLFFAPILGQRTADLSVTAQAAMIPAAGFKVLPGSTLTAGVVPIAIDDGSWNNLMNGLASDGDNFSYDPATNAVVNGSDGVPELNIFPDSDATLPPGNRGTVDFGSANNSTADLSRQILYGLNDSDLSYFPNNEFNLDNTPIDLNGDPGISAGIKDELATIIGQPRAFPIFSNVTGPGNNATYFSNVTGPGNNATYTIIKFVGATILEVELTGANKRVIVQPATFVDSTGVRGEGGIGSIIQDDTIFAPLYLYK
jgi:hypothetical protein